MSEGVLEQVIRLTREDRLRWRRIGADIICAQLGEMGRQERCRILDLFRTPEQDPPYGLRIDAQWYRCAQVQRLGGYLFGKRDDPSATMPYSSLK